MNENNRNPNGLDAQTVTPQPASVADADRHPPSAVSHPDFSPAKGESDRAFEAFRAYLELGPRRRYAAVGRKVGASLRTVQRWANDFDWRGRIKSHAARCAEQSAHDETVVQHEDRLDAAARAKAFRERQFAVAEAVLDLAERYIERVEDEDLEQMRFSDACKALDFASRIAGRAQETDAAAPDHGLRDQLASLLNQTCAESPARAKNQ